jgi:hypothetical protein
MIVLAKAVCFIIFPFSFIDISVSMYQATSSIRLVGSPVSLVERPVCPNLHTLTIANISIDVPLAFIASTVFQSHNFSLGSADGVPIDRLGVVIEVTELIFDTLNKLVVIVRLLIVDD